MKTAIVHEWLVNYAGSERVLEQIIRLYPDADLFSVCDFLKENERDFILNKEVETSFIQKLPLANLKYRNYLPLMPFAMKRLDLSKYDLIISNSHSVAKGVEKNPGQLEICYCHTPMRYIWDLQEQYLRESGLESGIKGAVIRAIFHQLRKWDVSTSKRVDHFIVNSYYIKDRVQRAYGRDAKVIYPPVDINNFQLRETKEDFFLAVSRMVPYKKMDLIVEAFSEMKLPLVVIGDGPDFEKVRNKAGKNIEFLGFQKDSVLKEYMQKARAFIFAAEEDFGIVPVEAQACGTPVIAFGKGGATETVISVQDVEQKINNYGNLQPTGVFFYEQTTAALIEAIRKFERLENSLSPHEIRKNAERFSIDIFKKEFNDFVDDKVNSFF